MTCNVAMRQGNIYTLQPYMSASCETSTAQAQRHCERQIRQRLREHEHHDWGVYVIQLEGH